MIFEPGASSAETAAACALSNEKIIRLMYSVHSVSTLKFFGKKTEIRRCLFHSKLIPLELINFESGEVFHKFACLFSLNTAHLIGVTYTSYLSQAPQLCRKILPSGEILTPW